MGHPLTKQAKDARTGTVLLAPALLFIGALTVYPLFYSLWASFTNLRLTSPVWNYVGFETYWSVISNDIFRHSLLVTVVFLLVAVSLEFVAGFALALSFRAMRGTHAGMRALLMLPVMATPVSVGLVWKLILNEDFGIVVHAGSALGLGVVPWLSDTTMAVVSIILMDVWQWTPFMFLILLAGLEGLPADLFEAAEIDGAKRRHILLGITLPLMAPIIAIALVFRLMFAVATFDSVFVLTKGGPALSTDLVTLFIQREGLMNLNVASASAASFLVLIIVFLAIKLLFRKGLVIAS
jgi:multiple sugar transport system permease protein